MIVITTFFKTSTLTAMELISEIQDSWGWIGIHPQKIVNENSFGNLIIEDKDGRFWRLTPEDLFADREMSEFSQFRVTRHSDLEVDEAEHTDLRTALRLGLQHRNFGQAVRLEVSSGCSEFLSSFLLKQFALPS